VRSGSAKHRSTLVPLLLLVLVPLVACTKQVAPPAPATTTTAAPTTASTTAGRKPITQEERGSSAVDAKYAKFRAISSMGPVVPGLMQDLVPQGLAYWPEQGWLVISYYTKAAQPSALAIVDARTGKLVKGLRMYEAEGRPYMGHAGGVAISKGNLWMGSGGDMFRMTLKDLLAAPDNGNIIFAGHYRMETNSSFVAYSDGILWAGEFYHPTAGYNTDPRHHLTNKQGTKYGAWVAGYRLDPATDQPAAAPDYLLSIRDQIQGMTVTKDSVILGRSYGRKVDSNLYRYVLPDLSGAPHQTVTVAGKTVPLWFLDETTQTNNDPVQVLPPMSEGVVTDGANRLFVLFESGANEYRFDGFNPLDRLAIVDLNAWTR
jgi:hypothetical protein